MFIDSNLYKCMEFIICFNLGLFFTLFDSALGSVLIVCGLYTVLWGKGKEMKRISQLMPSDIARESEAIEIVVTSKPVDDESGHNNINSNLNVANSEDSSKIGPHDLHDKHKEEQEKQIS